MSDLVPATYAKVLGVIDNERYPRMYTFRDQTALSDSTIRRVLRDLVDAGIIERHHRARGNTYWCRPRV